MIKEVQNLLWVLALLLMPAAAVAEASGVRTFSGVVTYHLIPAKVIRVNEIIKNPDPGASYIGKKSILVELDKNIDVRSNWTVVEVDYKKYPATKVIPYEVLREFREFRGQYT